ncbi:MAG: type II toxin-antitoxin system RelE/ParE family toxin [Rhodoferax sp.]|nr:type II toxin-antitoxin system RelE/ParE family toxin [Rhodoferax sp.]
MTTLWCAPKAKAAGQTRLPTFIIKVGGGWCVIYVAKHSDAVYVLHCFHKTTPRTAKADIDIAARRYKQIENSLKDES